MSTSTAYDHHPTVLLNQFYLVCPVCHLLAPCFNGRVLAAATSGKHFTVLEIQEHLSAST